jgi:DNA-binding helix-hairpin-helix protein with protein kinase domain
VNLRLETGAPVALGHVLAKAGEGTIYEMVGHPGWAAKVFHPTLTDLDNKLDKVSAMIQASPPGAIQPDGFVVLTWPMHTIADPHGVIGYVMPKISTATSVEIHTMSNPSNRREPPPNAPQWMRHATWGHLINVAANLCLAVEVVHRVDAVIGDFQERNILVSDTTEVTLVDCDSMQFTDPGGRQFLCQVGRPEFTAPELAGLDLRTQARQKPSDLFALAVHIHQLLMAGNHPFLRGEWTGQGEQPTAMALARSGHWAGGPSSLLRTHPMAPPVTFLPGEIQQLFSRAFTVGAGDPSMRPTAGEWRAALQRIHLRSCPRGDHQIPASCMQCPWCTIDDAREVRRQRTGGIPIGSTSPQKILPLNRTGPINSSSAARPVQGKIAGLSTRTIVAALIALMVIAVALATFIIWALMSGASTTFSAPGYDAEPRLGSVAVQGPNSL